jgi:hypothetical protein
MNKITLQRVKSKCYPPMSILQIMPEELSTHRAKEMYLLSGVDIHESL